METPDQYMHRAIRSDRAVAGTSADGSLTPLFPAQARGCPSYAKATAGRLPRTPPSGRPLDRVWVRPPTPVRGLLPSRPPGEAGGAAFAKLSTPTP